VPALSSVQLTRGTRATKSGIWESPGDATESPFFFIGFKLVTSSGSPRVSNSASVAFFTNLELVDDRCVASITSSIEDK